METKTSPLLARINEEAQRREVFPIASARNFLGHAGVTALPRAATDALEWFGRRSHINHQEAGDTLKLVDEVRRSAADLIGAGPDEIALLGPTALGLNLIADGISWETGDEVVFYQDDYPANVYPWRKLESRGVKPVALEVETQGVITWETVNASLSPRTRLVSLATANFLTGYRIDIDTIGRELHRRDILFCVDGIQTLGAFPFSVEHVDFLSADSHKWMLGPMGAGLVYVNRERFETCRPTLLGSWNVVSPNFIAQESIEFYEGARRYEPGSLNLPGIFSMGASLKLLLEVGIEEISRRIVGHRQVLIDGLQDAGWKPVLPGSLFSGDTSMSGIVTFHVPEPVHSRLGSALEEARISASLRHNREGHLFLRFSPHFYNTRAELDQAIEVCQSAMPA